jgi:hypothetical protein
MPTDIKIKNSVTATNAPTSLQQGEVAINITDKKVWVGNASTTPVLLLGAGSSASFTNTSTSGVASFADGTASLPSITNIGDTNTGMYFPAADTIGFTEGGVEALRINGSGQTATSIAGTAALPSFTRTSDENTGIFFPSADTIAFTEGGVESMRITSAGAVGIGTSSPNAKLDVSGSFDSTTGIGFRLSSNSSGANSKIQYSDSATYNWTTGATGNAFTISNEEFPGTAGTERMRIDTTGNLLVGGTASLTGSSRKTLLLNSAAGELSILEFGVNGTLTGLLYSNTTQTQLEAAGARPLVFNTNSAERMRIDSSGNLLVGTTSSVGKTVSEADGAGLACLALRNSDTGSGSQGIALFYRNGTLTGSISNTNTATAFNTSSDYRLKENIVPMTGALAVVSALKPVTYKWKADGSDGQGFIAHELQAVVPDAVTGEKDAVNEDGTPAYQGIDTSFLVATLTAAIQELKAEVDSLKQQLGK